jgi:hypothetical protein
MKIKIHLISVVVLLSSFVNVSAQSEKSKSKFWDKVTVRKAYESKTQDDSKPAIFSYTAPKDTTSSWLFNGGIGYDLFSWNCRKDSTDQQILSGFAVYNRNTLIDKKQKNYKIGLSMTNLFPARTVIKKGIYGTSTLQYMHNYIDTTHSAIVTSYWNPFYKSPKFISIGGYSSTARIVNYCLLPQFGLEYQNIFDANSKTKKGYDARAYFNLGLNVMFKKKTRATKEEAAADLSEKLKDDTAWKDKPFAIVQKYVEDEVAKKELPVRPKSLWAKFIEFTFAYAGRQSFISHSSNFEKYTSLFTGGVNMYPLNTENFSIGLSYNNGSNPIDGTPKQSFWLFSIAFKK